MKTRILIITAFISFIGLCSCKKDSDKTSTSIPRIATESRTSNGITESATYSYNSSGKLSKIVFSDSTYSTYDYTSASVTVNDYFSTGILDASTVYTLNSKGYATSASGTAKKKKSGAMKSLLMIPASTNSWTSGYEYNSDGYMTSENYATDSGWSYLVSYAISNGNQSTFTLSYPDGTSDIYSYAFLTGKDNTIGDENFGITFFGKQNKNLVSSSACVTQSYHSATTYEFDSKNRVIKSTAVDNSGTMVTNYTYAN